MSLLHASEPRYQPNTANLGFTVTLRNTSAKACVLRGWPGLSFRSDGGKNIADAVRNGKPASVRLDAGASTFVLFFLSNPIGGNGCPHPPTGSALLLTPPNDTASFRLHLPKVQKICHPVVFPVGRRT